jgi:hypothetical protein
MSTPPKSLQSRERLVDSSSLDTLNAIRILRGLQHLVDWLARSSMDWMEKWQELSNTIVDLPFGRPVDLIQNFLRMEKSAQIGFLAANYYSPRYPIVRHPAAAEN